MCSPFKICIYVKLFLTLTDFFFRPEEQSNLMKMSMTIERMEQKKEHKNKQPKKTTNRVDSIMMELFTLQ